MIIGLVSCCKKKRSTPMAASKLYADRRFYRSVAYAVAKCDAWVILSGKYGVVKPEQVIKPYDLDLRKQSRAYIKRWAKKVNRQLCTMFPGQDVGYVAMVDWEYLNGLEGLAYVLKDIK